MLAKKNTKYDFNKNSTLFFSLGLLCMTIFAYFAIELQVENKSFSEIITKSETIEASEEEPFVYQPKTQEYVPIKTVQFVEKFQIVAVDPIPTVITQDPIPDTQKVDPNAKPTEPSKPVVTFIAPVEDPDEIPFINIEDTPIFPGCENLSKEERDNCFKEKIMKHIQKNLRYPENALENDHQGRVNVQFIIEKDGSISIANLRGPYESLNKEASRVIKMLPKMKPGEQRKKAVKVSYIVPIVFKN